MADKEYLKEKLRDNNITCPMPCPRFKTIIKQGSKGILGQVGQLFYIEIYELEIIVYVYVPICVYVYKKPVSKLSTCPKMF